MNKELVITVAPTGHVSALNRDDILDLGFLGDKHIERASIIDFDEADQSFFIVPKGMDNPHPLFTRFSGYEVARNFEITYLQECMKQGVDPTTEDGFILASAIRQSDEAYRVHGKSVGSREDS